MLYCTTYNIEKLGAGYGQCGGYGYGSDGGWEEGGGQSGFGLFGDQCVDDRVEERRPHSRAEVEAAVGLVDSLVAPVAEPYRSMSTKDARLARLGIAGAAGEGRR